MLTSAATAGDPGENLSRTDFLDLEFDSLGEDAVVRLLARESERFRYVVTPNVDHVVRLHATEPHFRDDLCRAYREADLCLCDSRILRRLAARRGVDLVLVPGSDLTRRLFDEILAEGDRVTIIGGDEELVRRLQTDWPKVRFHHHNPPMGMLGNPRAMDDAVRFVAEHPARFTFLAVGSPQQEVLALRLKDDGAARGTALCVGAALEFLVGVQTRAPRFVQKMHLEWLHRLLSRPRRLWRRYLVEGPRIFVLSARWGKSSSD